MVIANAYSAVSAAEMFVKGVPSVVLAAAQVGGSVEGADPGVGWTVLCMDPCKSLWLPGAQCPALDCRTGRLSGS